MNTKTKRLIYGYTQSDPDVCNSALSFILGDYIGSGCSRTVFEFALDARYVVKLCEGEPRDNIIEWELWNDLKFRPEVSKWLAPCEWISADGKIMTQRKTIPIKELPDNLPHFLTDIKKSNFGKIGKQIVAHDYAHSLSILSNYANGNKMKKVSKIDKER